MQRSQKSLQRFVGNEQEVKSTVIGQFLQMVQPKGGMARDEVDAELPDQDQAKDFYATYEPKDVLGRYATIHVFSLQVGF